VSTPVRAKKQFGQNFLKDAWIQRQIIEAMPETAHLLVEIGPGLGDLTKELVKKRPMVVIEIDSALCDRLRGDFSHEIASRQLTLIEADVLRFWDQQGSLQKVPYDLVANLPYYIATEIILRAMRDEMCQSLLVMIQKEVARKFTARPGDRAFSPLAILAESIGAARWVMDVPPEAFDPVPKVDSAVIAITKEKPTYDEAFAAFLRRAFTQPRKQLIKNLQPHNHREELALHFEALGLDQRIRPHEMTTDTFLALYMRLKG
jgi:16S rRNA (adenine1518-N6/adenine1519-N6)-dimethyltransferase